MTARPAPRLLLGAFALAALGDLVVLLADFDPGHAVFKPLLMPLLAAHVAVRRGPRLLIVALLFGWGGDTLLLFDAEPAFLAGMGSFAAGHVCYLVLFQRYGEAKWSRARGAALVAAYALALVVTVALLWPDLPADMRGPVAGYSVLLTAMAFRATALGLTAAAGGALFLLSDTLIATGVAEWPQLPRPDFAIMLTYIAAQYLLAGALLRASHQRIGTGTAVSSADRATAAPSAATSPRAGA
ncbi:lysoplasmalogenase [Streptomyces sp. BG9H]|uniref:Lysoplasmalogenase n=1 Tax=Streptomyces anatolicus TaxID=2675858 RepID=A0ABS6YII7_9ACTN|nr:lysoplasmalogenase [Streptomyces anatolicus]MBW5421221.1 lysoplasmalogenase [Streptomyces anatolicus]